MHGITHLKLFYVFFFSSAPKKRVIYAAGTKLGNNGIDCSAVSDMFDQYHGILDYKVCDCTNLSKEMKAGSHVIKGRNFFLC
jgi:hypothetical protein